MSKIKKLLNNSKGESYIGAVVFVMIASFMLVFVIQMGGVVTTKLALDNNTKQIVKKIQLEGGLTEEANEVLSDIKASYEEDKNGDGDISDKGENLTIQVVANDSVLDQSETYYTQNKMQLGESFVVNAEVDYFIGFGELGVYVPLQSSQIGISEKYWKELS